MFRSCGTKFLPSTTRYSSLSGINDDHDSQTGVDEGFQLEVEKASGDKSPSCKNKLIFALLGTLVAVFSMGVIISALDLNGANWSRFEGDPLSRMNIKQFAPKVSTKTVVFSKKAELMEPPNAGSQKIWDALIPIGRGFVNISKAEAYGLKPGIPTASGTDRYAVAMFHQLHCLTALRDSYWRLMDAMSGDWTDAARQKERQKQLRSQHAQHCFAYIAESIWCSGDLTIEWAEVEKDGRRKQVDGWGIPHQCKDPEAIRAWVRANHGPVQADQSHLHD